MQINRKQKMLERYCKESRTRALVENRYFVSIVVVRLSATFHFGSATIMDASLPLASQYTIMKNIF